MGVARPLLLALQLAGAMVAGRQGKLVEAFKFTTYLAVPVFMVSMFTLNPENLEWIIRNRSYVVYPPEEQRPPIGDDMHRIVEARKK